MIQECARTHACACVYLTCYMCVYVCTFLHMYNMHMCILAAGGKREEIK